MFARVISVTVRHGTVEEFARVYRERVMPAARSQPGFKGALLLANPGNDKVVSITLWETREALEAGEAGGYLVTQLARLGAYAAGSPVREHFEVKVTDLTGVTGPGGG